MTTATDKKPLITPSPLFGTELRQAIRGRRKTQTRRVMDPQPTWGVGKHRFEVCCGEETCSIVRFDETGSEYSISCWRPRHGVPGDIWYLREPLKRGIVPGAGVRVAAVYADDGEPVRYQHHNRCIMWRWKRNTLPPLYVSWKYARTFMEVTALRVERLQDISEADAIAEGVLCEAYDEGKPISSRWWDYQRNCWSGAFPSGAEARGSFRTLWDSINAKRGYGWDANPWVWVYTFEVMEDAP